VAAITALALLWAYGPEAPATRRERVERLFRALPVLVAFLGVALLAPKLVSLREILVLPVELVILALLLLLAAVVAFAGAVVLRGLWAGRGRAWLAPARPSRRAAPARVCALALGGGLAAAVGACIGEQGLRDNTFVHATAFYTLVPLAGVVIGGQHLLPMGLRPVGAVLGGLAVAVVTPMGSDNLDSAPEAIVLAALVAALWRMALPPPCLAAAPAPGQPLAASVEDLHRRLKLA
jgi:hypothetical protein